MTKVIERATGTEYAAKRIEGGFEVYTLSGEKYKKIKESTFKRCFKMTGDTIEFQQEEAKQETEKKSKKQKKAPEPKVELEGEAKDNMIEKIKKILNLSKNNPSAEEGMAAALQAQKLMVKYNIHEDEVSLEEIKDEISEDVIRFKHNAHLFKWYKHLAGTVAKNFRVKTYLDEYDDVVFRGYNEDVKVAKEVYQYLYTLGNKLAGQAYAAAMEENGTAKGVYNSFITGFLTGITETLNEQCTALMIITPKAVEEDFEVFAKNFSHTQSKLTAKSAKVFQEGKTEGRNAVRSRQIKDKKNK